MNPYTPLPSFLEMMMMEEAALSGRKALVSGMDGLATSLSRMVVVASGRSTTTFQRIKRQLAEHAQHIVNRFGPELRFLVSYWIERQCIATTWATTAETIYGGRRSKLGPNREILEMDKKDKIRLALLLPLGSYVKERMDLFFRQSQQRRRPPIRPPTTQWEKLKSLYVTLYPYLRMTREGSVLAYQFLYLAGKSVYFSPWSHLLKLVVRRVTAADAANPSSSSSSTSSSSRQLSDEKVAQARRVVVGLVSSFLVVGWLSKWRQELRRLRRAQTKQPPFPPAPSMHVDPHLRLRPVVDPAVCPLCQQPRIHPVASTSGYVFCQRCLTLYVRQHGKCPLTGRDCPESRITRLYETTQQDTPERL